MNSSLTTHPAAPITMSSREIAELTGKEHFNVMRDIRTMLGELGGVISFEGTYVNPQNGQSYPCFNLPHRETMILLTGYSVPMRAKVVDRWTELESQATKHQASALTTMQMVLLSAQAVVNLEAKQAITDARLEALEAAPAGLFVHSSLPAGAQNITAIRKGLHAKFGLSSALVDFVLRTWERAPRPAGSVRNDHPDAAEKTSLIWWTKDANKAGLAFVDECVKVTPARYNHPAFGTSRFSLKSA